MRCGRSWPRSADRDELRERLMELCDAIRARQAAEAEVRGIDGPDDVKGGRGQDLRHYTAGAELASNWLL